MSENAPKTEKKKRSFLNKAVTKQGSNAKITAVIEHCRVWGGALTIFIFFDTFLRKFCSLGEKMLFQCGLFPGILLKPEKK